METKLKRIELVSFKILLSLFATLVVAVAQTGCSGFRADPQASGPRKTGDGGVIQTGTLPREGFFDGSTLKQSDLDAVVKNVTAGGVLILSEQHGNQLHYAHQKLALEAVAKTGACTVSVGLEFLDWTHQTDIANYFAGTMPEADFLAAAWGGEPWADYKDQALFPKTTGGLLIGVNAPRALTGAISKNGIEKLTDEQMKEMPPAFELGTAAYRERFDLIMGEHVTPSALDRYFAAQSVWDDTMAWQASEFLRANPKHCLAIIVGDFHAAWGGGLPNRLAARGIANVTVISQVETADFSEVDLSAELGPHPQYGARADAIWLSHTPQTKVPEPGKIFKMGRGTLRFVTP